MKLKKIFHIKTILLSMWSYRLVRIILATIFLWSGLTKLIDPASLCSYYRSLRADSGKLDHADSCRFTRFRDSLSYRPVAGYQRKSHHHTGLLFMFMAILIYGILIGLDVDCGCFGSGDSESEIFHGLRPTLYRDIMMMMGVVYLYLWRYYRPAKTA